MIKRIVIAGSRDYLDYDEAKKYIDICLESIDKKHKIIILSGGAKGADALGERYAIENNIELEKYPAEWSKYGRKAGPIRNRRMAELCDIVICFWDGKSKGTRSLIDYAAKLEKNTLIKLI